VHLLVKRILKIQYVPFIYPDDERGPPCAIGYNCGQQAGEMWRK